MKKLSDVKDANGTSLQTYVDLLIEKISEAEASLILLIGLPPENLIMVSNIPEDVVADAMSQFASVIRKQKPVSREEKIVNPPETQTN